MEGELIVYLETMLSRLLSTAIINKKTSEKKCCRKWFWPISGNKNFVGGSEDSHGGPLSCSFFRQIGSIGHVYILPSLLNGIHVSTDTPKSVTFSVTAGTFTVGTSVAMEWRTVTCNLNLTKQIYFGLK